VTVAEGVVTLEGFVAHRSDKFDVEELAASIAGVKDVENRLRVQRPGQARSEGSNGPMKSMQPDQESASSKPTGTPGTNGLRG
jgi:hypothetical protein